MNEIEIDVVVEAKDILGEGVIWNPDEGAVYWCDNLKPTIQRYVPGSGEHRVWASRPHLCTASIPTGIATGCTFGGDDLDVLYVTSATRFLEPGEAAAQPHAGALFAIRGTGARGIPEPYFKG